MIRVLPPCISIVLTIICPLWLCAGAARAQTAPSSGTSRLSDPAIRPRASDLAGVRVVRFLTADDYPPFDFMDPDGTLAGFNVDVARAICAELKVACTVQARPFPALLDALRTGKGDAVIASQSIPERAPPGILFTRPIYLTPGRFAVRKGAPAPTDMRGTTIGVMAGGAHAAFVAAYFRRSIVTTFAGAPDLEAALKSGNVDAIFSDGPSLAAWLASAGSSDCCAFAGGPYLEPRYFGHGAGIAVRRDDRSLAASFDRALWVLEGDGRLSEIERKYFPVPFQ